MPIPDISSEYNEKPQKQTITWEDVQKTLVLKSLSDMDFVPLKTNESANTDGRKNRKTVKIATSGGNDTHDYKSETTLIAQENGSYAINKIKNEYWSDDGCLLTHTRESVVTQGKAMGITVMHEISFLTAKKEPVTITIYFQNKPGQPQVTQLIEIVKGEGETEIRKLADMSGVYVPSNAFGQYYDIPDSTGLTVEQKFDAYQKIEGKNLGDGYGVFFDSVGGYLEVLLDGDTSLAMRLIVPHLRNNIIPDARLYFDLLQTQDICPLFPVNLCSPLAESSDAVRRAGLEHWPLFEYPILTQRYN